MAPKINISIADLLGAILFAAPKRRKIVMQNDEGQPIESEQEFPLISIQLRDGGLLCTLPASEIMEYKKTAKFLQFEIFQKQGMEEIAVITLEEKSAFGELLQANGSHAIPANNLMSKFVAELNGLKIDEQDKIQSA